MAETLAELLAARGDPMAACDALPWLERFKDVPDDASIPLAMSGPHPRAVGSYGGECIEWASSSLGVTPRWWQALAITRQLEHDADGALVWREVVESAPRRAGKSVRLRISALWRVAHADRIGEKQLAMLVSKDLAVGKEIHRGAWRWAEGRDWKVIRLNGGQEIEAPDESRWLLRADTAVYGYDVGYGQVDESWGINPQAITDGLEPALLERLWSQLHMTSTAHVNATSLMRRRLVAALRNADQDVLLLFWGAHPNAAMDDEATWRAASPHWTEDRRALIRRKYAAALAGQNEPEFDDPDPVRGWAAQYLNIWPLLLTIETGILGPKWASCATSAARPKPVAIGVAVSLKHDWASIAAAGMHDDGVPHVDAVKRERGDSWLVAEVKRIQDETGCPVAINGKGPASDLIDDLEDAGVRLEIADTDAYVSACESFYRRVQDVDLRHGQTTELDDAVRVVGWRDIGERRAFGHKKSTGDISMLEAATLAAWAAETSNLPLIYT